ncbi:MAG: Uma2 family endonuclease [Candidatus Competibacter sp.]|nr:Uma2 family endonuclease [Candidatus Competibacter sp.]
MVANPAHRLLNFEDYLTYDDNTDNRYELVDGALVAMTPPLISHLDIAKFIERCFDQEIQRLNLPWCCYREAGLRVGIRKSRIMDVCVIEKEYVDVLRASGSVAVFENPPKLIVEIVSPESIRRDYRYKRSEYAAVEVPEYWIVDPLEQKATVLSLEDGLYEDREFTGSQKIISRIFPELELTAETILHSQ